jgi:L-fuculose-phosphate aldolase
MNKEDIENVRKRITELGQLMFDRFLTDSAGGNISARVGDLVCITPRYAGSRHQWRLTPNQVLVCDQQGNKLDGEGEISREARVHLRLYHDYPDGMAVFHSHPRNVLVFCSAGVTIPPVLEDTWKFGEIKVATYAPAHSSQIADYVSEGFRGQEDRIRMMAAGVIARWHGLFVIGKDLNSAFDVTERIDTNARCILLSPNLQLGGAAARSLAVELAGAIASFKK